MDIEKYKPTPEDIKKADSMMTPEQKAMNQERMEEVQTIIIGMAETTRHIQEKLDSFSVLLRNNMGIMLDSDEVDKYRRFLKLTEELKKGLEDDIKEVGGDVV